MLRFFKYKTNILKITMTVQARQSVYGIQMVYLNKVYNLLVQEAHVIFNKESGILFQKNRMV